MNYTEREERPWGRYFTLQVDPNYKLKRIEVEPGQRLSYQYHKSRSEAWTVVSGSAIVTINGDEKQLNVGETVFIPQGAKHRVENKSKNKLELIEVQTGSYFGEDDIVRIQDDYNR